MAVGDNANATNNDSDYSTLVGSGKLVAGYGLERDAHGGDWHRQISLLGIESIEKMQAQGAQVAPGDFAENITTRGLDLPALPIGTRLCIGRAVIEVTQIGKECHQGCEIMNVVGSCIMLGKIRLIAWFDVIHEDTQDLFEGLSFACYVAGDAPS